MGRRVIVSWAALEGVLPADEGSFSLYSVLARLHLECWVQFWASQYKRCMGILETAQ